MLLTVHLHFTQFNIGGTRILVSIRFMSPVVVVNDVSPVVRTADDDRIRYRCSPVVGVPKTQYSVLFACCVTDIHGESQERGSKRIVFT